MKNPIGIFGAGKFGRSLASVVSSTGRPVIVQTENTERAKEVEGKLSGEHIEVVNNPSEVCERATFLVFCVASDKVLERLSFVAPYLHGGHVLVHSVGALTEGGRRVSQCIEELTPVRRVGALAGPSRPGGEGSVDFVSMVVASPFKEVIDFARESLAIPPAFRIYGSSDLPGVEYASAFASAYPIALGIALSLGLGPGSRSVLLTRAVAEASRLIQAAGGSERTFSGLSGLGNMLVRAEGSGSPAFELGKKLGKGETISPDQIAEYEGARAAFTAMELAVQFREKMPVMKALTRVLRGEISPKQAAYEAADHTAQTE